MYSQEIREMSGLTSIQIQALVRNMDESVRRHRRLKETNKDLWAKKLADENQRLLEEFPGIFEMHADGKLDETFFYMLQLRHRIDKGEMTEDEASKLVGQKLFDRYVAPVVEGLPTPPALSYEEYYKQFQNASNSKNSDGNLQ
jgi:uncharacterized short protein YbdD (DUF466 family)